MLRIEQYFVSHGGFRQSVCIVYQFGRDYMFRSIKGKIESDGYDVPHLQLMYPELE